MRQRKKDDSRTAPKNAQRRETIIGDLRLHRDGYGFVCVEGAKGEDVFIPARYVGDALNMDVVEARVMEGRQGKKEGRIVQIVERRLKKLMGRFERVAKVCQVVADDQRVRHRIVIPHERINCAKHGDNVVILVLKYPRGEEPMIGEVMQILGRRGEIATEKSAIIARHQLTREFSKAVIDEAEGWRKSLGEDQQGQQSRKDLRGLPFVTIDGETARDFDDAVAVERLSNGLIRLWVAIADVSFFVRPGTKLDKAAYERGTSVYFPDDCLPMLPEALSNDLCSLVPDKTRFTMVAEMDIDVNGRTAASRFYKAVIKSRARMTYTAVKKLIVEKDAALIEKYRALLPSFKLMEGLYLRLRARREARGSIDFDLPEPQIVMDIEGGIDSIVRAERHVGHMMIEEFMIAANEAVAEFLTAKKTGCVYRVHERPPADKLHEFSVLLHNMGHHVRLPADAPPVKISKVLDIVKGRPEERFVNHMMLRTMAQAVYSTENVGHFGLASKCYCHFTSPIRRYPDLVVHRLLTRALGQQGQQSQQGQQGQQGKQGFTSYPPQNLRRTGESPATKPSADRRVTSHGLKEIAQHSSRRERTAMEAERETAKLYAAMFMQRHIGQEFDGVVSHVTKFGFFVELIEYFVEGLVHMNTLDDDLYKFEEEGMTIKGRKKGKVFKVGGRVRIEVDEVDVPNREIMFLLV